MNDFKIFVPLLKSSTGSDGRMRFHGIASSTTKDRHGDVIRLSALSEMEKTANRNMTIFLNHSYQVPEDVAGSVERAVIRQSPDPDVHDLVLDIVVNDANPRAVAAWQAIDRGTQLGLSIGARIPDNGATRTKDGRYVIDHIDLLETSLVGVPANPRSWVEYAVKSLRSKSESDAPVLRGGIAIKELEEALSAPVLEEEPADMVDVTASADNPDEPDAERGNDNVESVDIDNSDEAGDNDGGEPDVVLADYSDADDLKSASFATDSVDGDAAAPQEALPSDPGNGDVPVNAPAELDLQPTVLASIAATNELLRSLTRELSDERERRVKAEQERDQAVLATSKVLSDTASLLERLKSTPMGRRAVVTSSVTAFESLKSVYDDGVLEILTKQKD